MIDEINHIEHLLGIFEKYNKHDLERRQRELIEQYRSEQRETRFWEEAVRMMDNIHKERINVRYVPQTANIHVEVLDVCDWCGSTEEKLHWNEYPDSTGYTSDGDIFCKDCGARK